MGILELLGTSDEPGRAACTQGMIPSVGPSEIVVAFA